MRKIFFLMVIGLVLSQITQAVTSKVTLDAMYNITPTTATANVSIYCDTTSSIVFTYGVCYSTTNTTPTTSDSKASGSSGTGVVSFNSPVDETVSISGLAENNTYYIRAYATSAVLGKTFYGQVNTLTTPHNVSRALNFDGTNDYVAIPDNNLLDLTTNYTITAWIKVETLKYLVGIVSKHQTTSATGYVSALTDISPYTGLSFDEMRTSEGLLTDNAWHHVASVKSGSTRTLYFDGVAQGLSGTPITTVANTDSVRIGLDTVDVPGNAGRYFDGAIDEVSIWSKALTQSEITSGMNNGFTGKESNLVAYYRFDQGTASGTNTGISTLTDATSNNLTGYLRNFTRTGSSSNFVSGVFLGSTTINTSIATSILKCIYKTVSSSSGSYTVPIIKATNYFSMETDHTAGSSESHKYSYGACWSTTNPIPTMNSCDGRDESGFGGLYGDDSYTGYGYAYIDPATPGTTYYIRPVYCIDKSGFSGYSESDYHYGDVLKVTYLGPPTATTSAVSNIGSTTATGAGSVTNLGNNSTTISYGLGDTASISAYGVCWSNTNTTPTISDNVVSNGTKTATGDFTSSITGLTPGTKYYVRAYATNSQGTSYGSVVNFTTLTTPGVTTSGASNDISTTTLTATGTVTSLGNQTSISAYGVCWSNTDSLPTISDNYINKGTKTSTGDFTCALTGLTSGSKYYVRAYATNSIGTAYGNTVTFSTLKMPTICVSRVNKIDSATTVTLDAISNVTSTSALANISIHSDSTSEQKFTFGVCYSSLHSPTIADTLAASGVTARVSGANSSMMYAKSITNLVMNKTYYVRAYAVSEGGQLFYSNMDSIKTIYTDRALNFDGSNDYVSIPDNNLLDLTTTYTITAWIKPETFGWLEGIVSKYQTGNSNGYVLRLSNASPYRGLNVDNINTSNSSNLLTANNWYYVVSVKEGSGRTLYVNGTPVSFTSSTFMTVKANSDQVRIGSDFGGRYFDGVIDDVSIWSKALSQSEVQAGMNNGFSSSDSGLVAYYKFDQGTANGTNTSISTLTDATANGLNGTLNNFSRSGTTSNFVRGAHWAQITNKSISTRYVSDITNVDAGLQGSYFVQINNVNSTDVHSYSYGFCWSSTNSAPTVNNGSFASAGSGSITGEGSSSANSLTFTLNPAKKSLPLTAGTTYYARAYLMIDSIKYYGEVVSFTTLADVNSIVTNVGTSSATINGYLYSLGNPESITQYGVDYNTTNSSSMEVYLGSLSKGGFAVTLSGLTLNTTYSASISATNNCGWSESSVISFSTLLTQSAPSVNTQTTSSVVTTTAVANGSISSLGIPANVTDYGFCWSSTDSLPTTANSFVSKGATTATGAFSASITGLLPGTTYYIRAYATNAAGTTYGNSVSFSTMDTQSAPSVSTQPVSNIVTTTAVANGSISSLGIPANVTDYGFCWSSTDSLPTTANSFVSKGATTATGAFSSSITGLLPGTTYYIRAYATNAAGTTYGNSVSFSTMDTLRLALKVYLEGVWNGASMNQCVDENGATIFSSAVDVVTVELHNSAAYSNIVYSVQGLYLEPDGTIHQGGLSNIKIPAIYSGNYYITVKSRNCLATTSAAPVSLLGDTISYDFTSAANKAYGDNMIAVSGGYAFYAGDINQDGTIDSTDVALINYQINNFGSGYLPEDINGDGQIDASDIAVIENNVNNSVPAIHP